MGRAVEGLAPRVSVTFPGGFFRLAGICVVNLRGLVCHLPMERRASTLSERGRDRIIA